MGSFIRIGPGIEEGEPSSCGGAPRGVVPGGHKLLSPLRVLRFQNLPINVNFFAQSEEILESKIVRLPDKLNIGKNFCLKF